MVHGESRNADWETEPPLTAIQAAEGETQAGRRGISSQPCALAPGSLSTSLGAPAHLGHRGTSETQRRAGPLL